MNKIKILSLCAIAGLMAAVTACTTDKDNPNPLSPSTGNVEVTTDGLAFDFWGGEATFTVKGGTAFVRPETTWLTYKRLSGDDNLIGDKSDSQYKITCVTNSDFKARRDSILINLNGAYKWIPVTQEGPIEKPEATYTFRTANEVAQDMYPGWNLGNTLEAGDKANNYTDNGGVGQETSWQSTRTTQEIIDAVKNAGFKSVRIPTAWICGHCTGDAKNPTIDPYWMERVKEIVEYCINDGLYVVLNDHYDGGWLEVKGFSNKYGKYVEVEEDTIAKRITTMKALWKNLAEEFKNYDEHVIFAGQNEPFQDYDLFNGRAEELTPILIRYNKAFVDAVRATGGNNANRILVVQGSGASIDYATTYMPASTLPEAAGKLMVEIHYYDPGQFCGTYDATGDNAYYYWGANNHGADHNPTYGEEAYMQAQFAKLNTTYTSKGYPVIIGEYAGMQRTLTATGTDQSKHNASVTAFYKAVNEYGVNNGCVPFAWDTNDTAGLGKEAGSSTIIDRKNATVVGTNAMNGINAGVAAGSWMSANTPQ